MRKEEILNLLEEGMFEEEQNYVSTTTKKVNIGRLGGLVYLPDTKPVPGTVIPR